MGLSSTKTKTNSKETATTQPNTPAYAMPAIEGYYGQVGNLGQQIAANPSIFSTPANALQQQAGTNAANAGGWSTGLNAANDLASGAANTQLTPTTSTFAGTTLAGLPQSPTAQGYNPATGQANQATAATLGPAQQAGLFNATAPTVGNAQQAGTQGYSASQYNAPTLGNATTANAANVGNIERVNPSLAGSASILDNPIANYLNPVTQNLVDTSLAGFDDNAGRVRAQQAAQAAGAGAFGGSRYAIREAQTEADLARERASLDAGLRSSAFDRATSLAAGDTANRQNTGLFNTTSLNNAASQNANAQNTRSLTQAGLDQSANLFNADAQNQFGLAGAQLAADQGMFNAGAQNAASQFGANAANQANLFNTDAANNFALTQAGLNQQTGLANQAAGNQNAQFNTGAANDFALNQAGLNQQASIFNTGAQNDLLSQNLNAQNQASQSNAGAQNDLNSLIYGTQAQNASGNADRMNQASIFNAGQANNTSQFNSQLQQQQVANALQAAGLMGNNATNAGQLAQGDIQNQMAAGNSLFDIQRQQDLAPLTSLAALQGLLDPAMLAALSGQTINTQGESTTKQGNGLLGQIIGSLIQAGGTAAMSERRVKRDIEQIDTLPDGLGVYEFNYLWDEPEMDRRIGVMVDEVETLRPWALGPIISGIQTVDYSRLEGF